jgi:predicted nucleic acid-binding protein
MSANLVKQIIYLDLCCFNRPFDEQRQTRVQIESQAKLHIQALVVQSKVQLVWSYVLDYENSLNPIASRRQSIQLWRAIAHVHIAGDAALLASADALTQSQGLKSFDALHIACALSARAQFFVTTDDFILKKMKLNRAIQVVNPVEA